MWKVCHASPWMQMKAYDSLFYICGMHIMYLRETTLPGMEYYCWSKGIVCAQSMMEPKDVFLCLVVSRRDNLFPFCVLPSILAQSLLCLEGITSSPFFRLPSILPLYKVMPRGDNLFPFFVLPSIFSLARVLPRGDNLFPSHCVHFFCLFFCFPRLCPRGITSPSSLPLFLF